MKLNPHKPDIAVQAQRQNLTGQSSLTPTHCSNSRLILGYNFWASQHLQLWRSTATLSDLRVWVGSVDSRSWWNSAKHLSILRSLEASAATSASLVVHKIGSTCSCSGRKLPKSVISYPSWSSIWRNRGKLRPITLLWQPSSFSTNRPLDLLGQSIQHTLGVRQWQHMLQLRDRSFEQSKPASPDSVWGCGGGTGH